MTKQKTKQYNELRGKYKVNNLEGMLNKINGNMGKMVLLATEMSYITQKFDKLCKAEDVTEKMESILIEMEDKANILMRLL